MSFQTHPSDIDPPYSCSKSSGVTARKHDGAACPITQPRSQPDGYSSWSSASLYNWTWLSSSCSIDLHFPPEAPAGLIEAPQDFKIVAAITTEKQPARHCLLGAGATQLTAGGTAFPGCPLTWHCPSCTEISMCSRGEMTREKKCEHGWHYTHIC